MIPSATCLCPLSCRSYRAIHVCVRCSIHVCVRCLLSCTTRIVLYDTLIKQVTQQELLAILGHEIGHWKLWHTLQGFLITQIYTFVLFWFFSMVQSAPGMFTSFGFTFGKDSMPIIVGLVVFTQTFWSPVVKVRLFFCQYACSFVHRDYLLL